MTQNQGDSANLPAEIQNSLSGLPAPVETAALKAFSRLLGGLTSYFAAWARRPAQAVEDKTDAQSLIVQSLARAAAEQAASNPELVEAAMKAYLPSQFRKHANKEKVVHAAAEALAGAREDIAGTDAPQDVDEDWLNTFERFAEDASSERLQRLWGRVLAGEIKTGGAFSKRTLRFIAELDAGIAKHCELLANHLVEDFFFFSDEMQTQLFLPLMEIEHCGLVEGTSSIGLQKVITIPSEGTHLLPANDRGLLFLGEPGTQIRIGARSILTSTGKEVFSLLDLGDLEPRLRALSESITGDQNIGRLAVEPNSGLKKVDLVRIKPEDDERWRYWFLENLWTRPDEN